MFSSINEDDPDRCTLEQPLPQPLIHSYKTFFEQVVRIAQIVIKCLGPGYQQPNTTGTQPKLLVGFYDPRGLMKQSLTSLL